VKVTKTYQLLVISLLADFHISDYTICSW